MRLLLATSLSVLIFTSPGMAQPSSGGNLFPLFPSQPRPTPPPTPKPRNPLPPLRGASSDQEFLPKVQLLVRQLVLELEHLQEEVREHVEGNQRLFLDAEIDRAIAGAKGLTSSLQTGMDRNPLYNDYDRLSRDLERLMTRAEQVAGQHRHLHQVLTRLHHDAEQLRYALFRGAPTDTRRVELLVRLSRDLDYQARELLESCDEFPWQNRELHRRFEDSLREMARCSNRMTRFLDRKVDPERALREFAVLNLHWRNCISDLNELPPNAEFRTIREGALQTDARYRQLAEELSPKTTPPPELVFANPVAQRSFFVTSAGSTGGPHVRIFTEPADNNDTGLVVYDYSFEGGVRTACGDVNGDGIADIISVPGSGMPSTLKVFDGRTREVLRQFEAFERNRTGAFVAFAKGPRDSRIVVGTDEGPSSAVRVFSARQGTQMYEFYPYGRSFRGGIRLAAGDFNNDGFDDIVTVPGQGMSPVVRIFDGDTRKLLGEFLAYDRSWTDGLFVAVAQADSSNPPRVVVGPETGGGPHVKVFSGMKGQVVKEFFPYAFVFRGGVRVAAADMNNDGVDDFITAPGPGMESTIYIYDGKTYALMGQATAYITGFLGGSYVSGR